MINMASGGIDQQGPQIVKAGSLFRQSKEKQVEVHRHKICIKRGCKSVFNQGIYTKPHQGIEV